MCIKKTKGKEISFEIDNGVEYSLIPEDKLK